MRHPIRNFKIKFVVSCTFVIRVSVNCVQFRRQNVDYYFLCIIYVLEILIVCSFVGRMWSTILNG
jgi:hypothetical protein